MRELINEQDKQAILAGAYGITRSGQKVKHVFTSNTNTRVKRNLFILYENTGGHSHYWASDNFTFYTIDTHSLDVVGLWEDKPEPFDLDRALAGEPIHMKGSNTKAYISGQSSFDSNTYIVESIHGVTLRDEIELRDNFVMWKEPEFVNPVSNVELPKPITEPLNNGDDYYLLGFNGGLYYPVITIWGNNKLDLNLMENSRIYKTKEDVIKVIVALTGKPFRDITE